MMVVVLVAGIGFVLAGLVAVGFGIPVNEFSFGNTLITSGVVTACTGAILIGLWIVVRELKATAARLGAGIPPRARAGSPLPSAPAVLSDQAPDAGFPFSRDEPQDAGAAESAASSPPPWQDEVLARDRTRHDAPSEPEPAPEAAPAVKPRRNLLFSSSSRKERERAQARTADPVAPDFHPAPAVAPPPPKASEPAPPATFDDAWPQSERARAVDVSPRRSGRTPSTFTEGSAGATGTDRNPPAPRNEEQPPVTVLKSGVVDGMAYSLYSDGSIEAQMPEGMMRFASIDELRSHLDQRP
jgi:hypothetical protein